MSPPNKIPIRTFGEPPAVERPVQIASLADPPPPSPSATPPPLRGGGEGAPISPAPSSPACGGGVSRKATDGGGSAWRIPEETPVAFIYNGRNYAVMMATPADFADFAVGFSLTERVVDRASEIEAIDIHQTERGVELRIRISDRLLERLDLRQQRRNLVGRAGCGVCGLENAEAFFEPLPKVADAPVRLKAEALLRALAALPKFQPLNERTRTVHAAAFAGLDGEIQLAREDVGRHNALDKLLGALARDGRDAGDGFVVMSSRCSYEIVEKAARLGVTAVLSISAPTAFAVRKAEEAAMALYVRAGEGVVAVEGH